MIYKNKPHHIFLALIASLITTNIYGMEHASKASNHLKLKVIELLKRPIQGNNTAQKEGSVSAAAVNAILITVKPEEEKNEPVISLPDFFKNLTNEK